MTSSEARPAKPGDYLRNFVEMQRIDEKAVPGGIRKKFPSPDRLPEAVVDSGDVLAGCRPVIFVEVPFMAEIE